MIIAEDQHARMGRIMQLIVRHTVADAGQQYPGIVGFVIVGKIVNMRILHHIFPWRKRRFVAACQRDGGASDMMNMGADDGVIRSRCPFKVVVIES